MSVEQKFLRPHRTSLMLMAQVYRHDRAASSAHRLLNLSETGARLSGGRDLREGSVVSVSIGLIEHMPADVVWVSGDAAGLKFHSPIDLGDARARRPGALPPPASGWLNDLQNPYRR